MLVILKDTPASAGKLQNRMTSRTTLFPADQSHLTHHLDIYIGFTPNPRGLGVNRAACMRLPLPGSLMPGLPDGREQILHHRSMPQPDFRIRLHAGRECVALSIHGQRHVV